MSTSESPPPMSLPPLKDYWADSTGVSDLLIESHFKIDSANAVTQVAAFFYGVGPSRNSGSDWSGNHLSARSGFPDGRTRR